MIACNCSIVPMRSFRMSCARGAGQDRLSVPASAPVLLSLSASTLNVMLRLLRGS